MKNKFKDEIVYSKNLIFHSIEKGNIKELFISEKFNEERILNLIKNKKIHFQKISDDQFRKRFNSKECRGIAASLKPFEYYDLQKMINESKAQKNPLIVMLDGIEDPHNLGAILRILDAFSVDGLIIRNKREVKPNTTVSRISTGAINYVKIALVSNLSNTVTKLKKEGFFVIATDGDGTVEYQNLKYDFPTVVIIGSEGNGVSRLLKNNSDYVVKIPMTGHVNSLNASTATGIFLANIRKEQKQ